MDRATYYEELRKSSKFDCNHDRAKYKKVIWRDLYDFGQLEEIPDAFQTVTQKLILHELYSTKESLDKVLISRAEDYFVIFITASLELLYGNDQLHLLSRCSLLLDFDAELKWLSEPTWFDDAQTQMLHFDKLSRPDQTSLVAYIAALEGFQSLCNHSINLKHFANQHQNHFKSFDQLQLQSTSTNAYTHPVWTALVDHYYLSIKNQQQKEIMVRLWEHHDDLYRRRARHRQMPRHDRLRNLGLDQSFYSFCKDNQLLRYYRSLGVPIEGLAGTSNAFHYYARLVSRLNLVLYAFCVYAKKSRLDEEFKKVQARPRIRVADLLNGDEHLPRENMKLLSKEQINHLVDQGIREAEIYARSSHARRNASPDCVPSLLTATFTRLQQLLKCCKIEAVENAHYGGTRPIHDPVPFDIYLHVMVDQLGRMNCPCNSGTESDRRTDIFIKYWVNRCEHDEEEEQDPVEEEGEYSGSEE